MNVKIPAVALGLSVLSAFAKPSVLEIGYVPEDPVEPAEGSLAGSDAVADLVSQLDETAAPAAEAPAEEAPAEEARPKRPARVTAKTTVYNRQEGVALFEGAVHFDDELCQMHADKVYLFLEGTNDIKRLVATGHVALTNETRRAYGTKATYTRKSGLVVLYGDEHAAAEVRDEPVGGDPQVVTGGKIRFWIDSQQVEVIDAVITGPASSSAGGTDALKKVLKKE